MRSTEASTDWAARRKLEVWLLGSGESFWQDEAALGGDGSCSVARPHREDVVGLQTRASDDGMRAVRRDDAQRCFRHAHCAAFGPLRWSWATVTSQSADGWVGGEVVLALLLGDREGLLYDFVCVPGSLPFPDGGSDNWLLLLRALDYLVRNLDLRRR